MEHQDQQTKLPNRERKALLHVRHRDGKVRGQSRISISDSHPSWLSSLFMSSPPGNLPVELYRPIVEIITAKCDLISLCLVCRAMRDEAERILYSAVRLTPATESLAIQLRDNHRQRRHISQFEYPQLPIPPKLIS